MKLRYLMDIDEKSSWFVGTPSEAARRLPLYLSEMGHYLAGPRYFTERSQQKNFLLLYTLSGCGYLKYLGGEYRLGPGQAAVISCLPHHLYRTASGDGNITSAVWNFKWLHFSGASAKEYVGILNGDSLTVTSVGDDLRFNETFELLTSSLVGGDIAASVRATALLTVLISVLIEKKFLGDGARKSIGHREDIETVAALIQRSYAEKLTLDDMVREVCVSRYYFARLFKAQMGVGPYEYLVNTRITKAKELLRTTDLSVGEICVKTGFGDYSNFIRVFHRAVGMTPQKYRRS